MNHRTPADRRRYPRQWEPWTVNEEQQVIELLQAGVVGRSLERRTGRSVRAIRLFFNKRGITISDLRRDVGGCRTMLEVARLMNVPHQTVYDWIMAKELAQAGPVRRTREPHRYITDDALMTFLAYRPAWPDWEPNAMTDADWRGYAEEQRAVAGGRWLTTADIASRYHVAPGTVTGWIARGALVAMERKRRYYVWSATLDTFIPPLEAYDRTAANHRAWGTRRQQGATQ